MWFDDPVIIAFWSHPIPFRTRPLNKNTLMVLRLKTRESKSLPDLLTTFPFLLLAPRLFAQGLSFYLSYTQKLTFLYAINKTQNTHTALYTYNPKYSRSALLKILHTKNTPPLELLLTSLNNYTNLPTHSLLPHISCLYPPYPSSIHPPYCPA